MKYMYLYPATHVLAFFNISSAVHIENCADLSSVVDPASFFRKLNISDCSTQFNLTMFT